MKNEISLEEIIFKCKFKIKLSKDFTERLFKEASKCEKPHCNLEFIEILGLKPTTKYVNNNIYRWIKKERALDTKVIVQLIKLSKISFTEVENNIIYIKPKSIGKELYISLPIKLDKKLGSIIGHILGDGSIDKRYQQVFFSNSEKELLKEFENNMKEIFGLHARIWMQKEPIFGNTHWEKRLNNLEEIKEGRNVGLFYQTICGLFLNTIFDDFCIGRDKKITQKIIDANKEFKSGLIRAFFDDESTVGKKNIRVFQDRPEILLFFKKTLFEEFNITSSELKTYIKRDKKRYYFDIFRKSNFQRFDKEIGFTSPKKQERLNILLIIKNIKNSK